MIHAKLISTMSLTSGQISVLREGRIRAAYAESPLVSSDDVWPASLRMEIYRLPAMSTAPASGLQHGLMVNLGHPTAVEWGEYTPRKTTMFPTGGFCLGSPSEDIPAFRWSRPLIHAVVHFSPELFPDGHKRFRLHAEMAATDMEVLRMVRYMQAELQRGAPNGLLFGESLAHGLAVYLHSRYGTSPASARTGGLGSRRRRVVLDYLHAHCTGPLTLGALASEAGLSLFHFARSFRQEFGVPPHQFLQELRIERGKHLLSRSSYGHAEISRMLGFSSPSHFTRVFRKVAGVTPAAFRNQMRGGCDRVR